MRHERIQPGGVSAAYTDGEPLLTVLLADDEAAMRTGVRRALEADGSRVVAEASSAAEALAAAAAHRPDVCLLSVHLPGDGIVATQMIRETLPDTKIVMLTGSDRDDDLFASLRAGADGYLLKTIPVKRLPYAIRGVVNGEAALPRELTSHLIREFRERGRKRSLPHEISGEQVALTAREFEVLAHLRVGDPTAMIAHRLQISEVTVRRHIATTVQKLGVRDRRGAVELLERVEQGEFDERASA